MYIYAYIYVYIYSCTHSYLHNIYIELTQSRCGRPSRRQFQYRKKRGGCRQPRRLHARKSTPFLSPGSPQSAQMPAIHVRII